MRATSSGVLPGLGTVLLLLLPGPLLSCAQTVSEYQVKAAYVYNFSKFVEWPAQAFAGPAAPIRLCVLNDQAFESELNTLSRQDGRRSRRDGGAGAKRKTVPARAKSCLSTRHKISSPAKSSMLLRGTSVLTVGESERFVEKGGIINFVLQDDRVQLQVNHKAATQAGLHISSRLLGVAKLVIE